MAKFLSSRDKRMTQVDFAEKGWILYLRIVFQWVLYLRFGFVLLLTVEFVGHPLVQVLPFAVT